MVTLVALITPIALELKVTGKAGGLRCDDHRVRRAVGDRRVEICGAVGREANSVRAIQQDGQGRVAARAAHRDGDVVGVRAAGYCHVGDIGRAGSSGAIGHDAVWLPGCC